MLLSKESYRLLKPFLPKHRLEDLEVSTYKDNDVLVEEGTYQQILTFLVKGKVKVFKDYENGKTLLLSFYNPLTVIGDVEFIRRSPATCSVKAVGEVQVVHIPFKEIDILYKKDYDFMYNLLKKLSLELLTNSNSVSLNLMYPLSTRLASYILSISQSKNKVIINNYKDLSHNLGSSYRHLNRTIKELVNKGIIHKEKETITILNQKELLKEARDNIYETNYDY